MPKFLMIEDLVDDDDGVFDEYFEEDAELYVSSTNFKSCMVFNFH